MQYHSRVARGKMRMRSDRGVSLDTFERRLCRRLFLAQGVAVLLLVATICPAQSYDSVAVAVPTASQNAECPLEEALDYQVVSALKVNGVTDEQFQALAAAGEIRATLDQVCIDEIRQAAEKRDANCETLNGEVYSRLSSYAAVTFLLFSVTGDAPTARANIRAILRNFLDSVPHRCWFQGMKIPSPSTKIDGGALSPAQCAALRANFEACKQQANSVLKRCTVTPFQRNCASTAPMCQLPPC